MTNSSNWLVDLLRALGGWFVGIFRKPDPRIVFVQYKAVISRAEMLDIKSAEQWRVLIHRKLVNGLIQKLDDYMTYSRTSNADSTETVSLSLYVIDRRKKDVRK